MLDDTIAAILAGRQAERELRDTLADLGHSGIEPAYTAVLWALRRDGTSWRIDRIERELRTSGVSHQVKRLIEMGLLRELPVGQLRDRREHRVEISEEGRGLLERLRLAMAAKLERVA